MSKRELAELRFGECELHLPPIMRLCSSCEKLYDCAHGERVMFGDDSVTDKVLKLHWFPSASELEAMSLGELKEFNAAFDVYQKREASTKDNHLTAGAYDRGSDRYVTDIMSGKDSMTPEVDSLKNKGLTAGCWDPKKKRWMAKK